MFYFTFHLTLWLMLMLVFGMTTRAMPAPNIFPPESHSNSNCTSSAGHTLSGHTSSAGHTLSGHTSSAGHTSSGYYFFFGTLLFIIISSIYYIFTIREKRTVIHFPV